MLTFLFHPIISSADSKTAVLMLVFHQCDSWWTTTSTSVNAAEIMALIQLMWMYAALLPQGWITGSSALNTFKRLRLTCSGFRCHGDQSFSNVSQHHCIERTRWCGPTWPRELWEGLTLLKCWRVVRLCVKLSWMTKGWTSAAKPQYCQSPESRVQVPVFVFDRD